MLTKFARMLKTWFHNPCHDVWHSRCSDRPRPAPAGPRCEAESRGTAAAACSYLPDITTLRLLMMYMPLPSLPMSLPR